MSRHRNVRNRSYSIDDDYFDEEYEDEHYPASPSMNQYLYRRDSPSKSKNLFSFIDQPMQDSSIDDADLVKPRLLQVKECISHVDEQGITKALRKNNYDVGRTIEDLAVKGGAIQEKKKVASKGNLKASGEDSRKFSNRVATKELEGKKSNTDVKQNITEKKNIDIKQNIAEKKNTDIKQNVAEKKSSNKVKALDNKVQKGKEEDGVALSVAEREAFEKQERKAQEACVNGMEDDRVGVSMVTIGHVDAGKSTIMGHMLYKLGYVTKRVMHKYEKESKEVGKSSFAFAWVMDADEDERTRGVTMDVGQSYFDTKTKHVTLLDAPGHRDFIPKMIAGASQADVAMLVVPASTGEFEAAFENSGQTKEHTLLVRSLGVTQMIIAVNKMDSVDWNEDRFQYIRNSLITFLQRSGFKLKNLWFIPVSGLAGENLFERYEKATWYTGPSLLDQIDHFSPPVRPISKPFRFSIADVFKSMTLGVAVAGRIHAGAICPGDTVLLMPTGNRVTIKAIKHKGVSTLAAKAGDNVELGISGVDANLLIAGNLLCSIANPIKLVRKFSAQIMVTEALVVPIIKGMRLSFHIHSIDTPVNVSKLIASLAKSGEALKKKPRCLTRNMSASVEISCRRPLCLDVFADFRQLGRFTLRDKGVTLAAGIVTELLT